MSFVEAFVKEISAISDGFILSFSIRYLTFPKIVKVLPAPAPAMTIELFLEFISYYIIFRHSKILFRKVSK